MDTRTRSGLIDFLDRFWARPSEALTSSRAAGETVVAASADKTLAQTTPRWWRKTSARRLGHLTVVTLSAKAVQRHQVVKEVLALYDNDDSSLQKCVPPVARCSDISSEKKGRGKKKACKKRPRQHDDHTDEEEENRP